MRVSTERPSRLAIIGAVLLGSWLAAPSFAAYVVGRGAMIAAKGIASGVPACSSCHGDEGGGQAGGTPRLAGLPAAYLTRQLEAFAKGARDNDVMAPLAKMMDHDAMVDVAAYYANLTPAAVNAKSGENARFAASGETLALRGDWAKSVPACASCHGARGLGVGAAFPQLAGQSAIYIAAQLEDWRDGRRRGDPLGLMGSVASHLDEAQIAAVAAYYETLPATGAQR